VGPALVYRTKRDRTTGRGAVCVFYGTQRLNLPDSRNVDLVIQQAVRLAQLDLPMAVRFDLGASNCLPWAHQFFRAPEHFPYIVAGPLSDNEVHRFKACLQRRGIITEL
jgi:hypothetical protein